MMFVPVDTLYMPPYYVISIPLTGQSHFSEYTVYQRRTAKPKLSEKCLPKNGFSFPEWKWVKIMHDYFSTANLSAL